jgi:hypothetical protein
MRLRTFEGRGPSLLTGHLEIGRTKSRKRHVAE